jgi:ATP-dependent helicase HrpA
VSRREQLISARRDVSLDITYPDLPVSARRGELAEAIRDHQVVVVAGETGSGKTTQLPKICLELGRGIDGLIGHTQPRRLAARTVAQRIATELGSELGDVIGYSVRFTDRVAERTRVRLMTDGILLAEIGRDRMLRRYDTLIIDEAHERSLNVDFLLGYLRDLLPRRPDLKLIITSATIDPARFAAHFIRQHEIGQSGENVPVIEVSGRTFPVEVRYRPLEPEVTDEDDVVVSEPRDVTDGIIAAVRELDAEPSKTGTGDILVFLSGEREIRDTADALTGLRLKNTEVLPLYARLSDAEQQRVFQEHSTRRIVLATNVAETSLTVPGIKYVIDPGTARISRYSRRTKVQRLPIEPVSQASANQRSGRCGRTSDGIAIRLYSEADFQSRPLFTDPEILRTNLAAVLLQMAALKLGPMAEFGFLDPPDRRAVRDGEILLHELGAFDAENRITEIGRRLARLPVDPRLGRMILAAEQEGCVREVLVLAAALSIPDPRERPSEHEAHAKQLHARFADEHSDFTAYLNLWNHLTEQRKELSGNAFRRMCREEYLHHLRVREWQDLVGQLRTIAKGIDIVESNGGPPGSEGVAAGGEPAAPDRVHAALLTGLLSHIGMRDGESRQFVGARNTRFVIAPGSPLSTKPPKWTVVAELVETSRLFGRVAARIDPETIEPLAAHLIQRSYSEPSWDARRGGAVAYERITLYGLPIVARRAVGFGSIDPEYARELFIRHALVEGDWSTRHRFFAKNQELREELAALEERMRRGDLVVGDEAIFAFYDSRIPAKILSQRHFDAWWKKQRHETPELLTMTRDDLLAAEADKSADEFPQQWQAKDVALPITYRFDPGADDDGATIHIPADVLARIDPPPAATPSLPGGPPLGFGWLIPGMREELVTALIRSLPKDLRRTFVPAPDTARAVLHELDPDKEPLLDGLQRALFDRSGVLVPLAAFDIDKLPGHLRMTFAVHDERGKVIAKGKDLGAIKQALTPPVQQRATGVPPPPESEVDPHAERRRLRAELNSPVKAVERTLSTRGRLILSTNPDGSLTNLIEDCADAAVDALLAAGEDVRGSLVERTEAITAQVERILAAAHDVRKALPAKPNDAIAVAVTDIKAQFARLLPKGFVAATGEARLKDLARYITAIARRLDALPRDPDVDRGRMTRVQAVQNVYDDLVRALPASRTAKDDVRDIAWFIEEFRVSLWAQQLGTARPVSEQRIYKAIDAITP